MRPVRRPVRVATLSIVSAPAASPAPQTPETNRTGSFQTNSLATIDVKLDLDKANLIGIYGKPSYLRALVRMPNGRFENLHVGGSFDGGKVVEITNSSVTYVKNGRSMQLIMPN